MQTTLKALFPAAAGKKNDARVIPQLPSKSDKRTLILAFVFTISVAGLHVAIYSLAVCSCFSLNSTSSKSAPLKSFSYILLCAIYSTLVHVVTLN